MTCDHAEDKDTAAGSGPACCDQASSAGNTLHMRGITIMFLKQVLMRLRGQAVRTPLRAWEGARQSRRSSLQAQPGATAPPPMTSGLAILCKAYEGSHAVQVTMRLRRQAVKTFLRERERCQAKQKGAHASAQLAQHGVTAPT